MRPRTTIIVFGFPSRWRLASVCQGRMWNWLDIGQATTICVRAWGHLWTQPAVSLTPFGLPLRVGVSRSIMSCAVCWSAECVNRGLPFRFFNQRLGPEKYRIRLKTRNHALVPNHQFIHQDSKVLINILICVRPESFLCVCHILLFIGTTLTVFNGSRRTVCGQYVNSANSHSEYSDFVTGKNWELLSLLFAH